MSKDISYFPNREIEGGWRLISADHASELLNINFNLIELEIKRQQLFFGNHPQSTVIIKDGYLVYENHSFMTLPQSRFDIFNLVFLPSAAYSPRDKAVPDGASFLCLWCVSAISIS